MTRDQQHEPQTRRLWQTPHLSIKSPDICIRDDLRDWRSERKEPEPRRTVAVEVEVLAEAHGERGPFVWRGHREELAHLEGRLASRAVVGAEQGVARDGENLGKRGF